MDITSKYIVFDYKILKLLWIETFLFIYLLLLLEFKYITHAIFNLPPYLVHSALIHLKGYYPLAIVNHAGPIWNSSKDPVYVAWYVPPPL